MADDNASKVAVHYRRYPYPNIPLIASIPKEQLWQINFDWLARQNGITPEQKLKPSIWIAGCGTFQPYTLAQANPTAKILATDLSTSSLKNAKRRCLLHSKRNIRFDELDLNSYQSYPDQKFDWIECYGVLMSVKDPVRVLQEMTKRLKPNGFIRIMVYPHYGRQRIFQIQEIARLLDLTLENPNSPKLLKNLMLKLPDSHPLKYAFTHYEDSRNNEGIADAFLHPNDRAFTGIEICNVIEGAGLEISYCMHRPWGQPREMAEKLGLLHHDPALWLHYLDLWQNLRSNFIFCLRKKNSAYQKQQLNHHALLDFTARGAGIKHRMRLTKLALTGARLQTRTEESPLYLTPREIRNVLKHSPEKLPEEKQKLFPGHDKPKPLQNLFQTTPREYQSFLPFLPRTGELAINPMYSHLFDAYAFPLSHTPLNEQIRILRKCTQPLESVLIPFGLTPLGTHEAKAVEVELLIKALPMSATSAWSEVRLPQEEEKFSVLESLLKSAKIPLPDNSVTYRKLWVLLCSYANLSLRFIPS